MAYITLDMQFFLYNFRIYELHSLIIQIRLSVLKFAVDRTLYMYNVLSTANCICIVNQKAKPMLAATATVMMGRPQRIG